MGSHPAVGVLEAQDIPHHPDHVAVTLVLACGCLVERKVARDRVQIDTQGHVKVSGRYRCPEGHPVIGEA